jgi:arylsulfatase A-like enzyme
MGRVLTGVALISSLAACAERPATEQAARHIVVISMDTARADHFGFLGNENRYTPRLDELASESITLTDYMTVAPTTLASHTSLFTGRYPHHHGTPRNGFMVHRENEMLPELLKQIGFHTAGFAASFALSGRFDFAQGFDHYDEQFDVLIGQRGIDQNQRSAADTTEAVIRYLDETGIPDRLFLFVHYFDPHQPYSAPAPFDRVYDPLGSDELPPIRTLRAPSSSLTRAEKLRYAGRHALHYAAEISYMDQQIGRLLDDLRERGVLDDALLIVTSDHGETLWEHGEQFDHGGAVFQTTIHAVCLIRLPGANRAGAQVGQPTTNIDIAPTVLEFLGVATPSEVDGEPIDLRRAGAPSRQRLRFGQATKPWSEADEDQPWMNARMKRFVRRGSFKFIQTPYRETEELYDLVSDPGETENLLKDPSPDIEALANTLRGELEAWAASADPLPTAFESSHTEETIERLRSLGYLP